jgi:hypothetical protein
VSEHYVRGTLTAFRGGTLTNAQRIERLWRLWEAEGGQRLAFADVARLVGTREGRVRQVLGPLRTAQRTTTDSADRGERPVAVEDDGRQAWLDRAACRDQDLERFFPESGEHTKAAEAKAICAGCQVRDSAWTSRSRPPAASTRITASSAVPCRASAAACAPTPSRAECLPAGSGAGRAGPPARQPGRAAAGRPPARRPPRRPHRRLHPVGAAVA